MKATYRLLGVSLLMCAACKEDGAPFLPLSELCEERSQVVCSALQRCCELPYSGNCVADQRSACLKERTLLEANDARSYDSEQANAQLDQQRRAADLCEGAVFPLAQYFAGGKPEGGSCLADSDCTAGLCDPDNSSCTLQEPAIVSFCPTGSL